ncbi:MAG: CRISPR-associated endonuclease Cas2 [Acidilobaceae archaeon]|nr:CRISPR-associated endonuclease Cas2 [Acidilobaceae archaeon]
MKAVVVYDISDNEKRLKVARLLEAYGLARIQRSAFVGNAQLAKAKDVARKLEAMIDEESDVVHIFFLQPQEWGRTIVIGKPQWVRRLDGVKLV